MLSFKLPAKMVLKKKVIATSLVIIILSSLLMSNPVLASHENPDEAEEDPGALIQTLERKKVNIESSLQEALKVNYSLEEEKYTPDHLNRSIDMAEEVEKELSKPDSVLEDIKGKIGSAAHLDTHLVPLLYISKNLTEYTKRHKYLIYNLSDAVQSMEGEEDSFEKLILNSRSHLNQMYRNLENMNETIQGRKEKFDYLTDLNHLQGNYRLYEDYKKLLSEIAYEGDMPSTVMIDGPDIGHPGDDIEIKVDFYDGDEFNTSVDISLFKEDNKTYEEIDLNYTIEEDTFYYQYEIDWNRNISSYLNFSAKVKLEGDDIESQKLRVEIVPYPSTIELDIEKEAYYDEKIEIGGKFKTEAAVDLSEIDLNIYKNDSFVQIANPSNNGSFNIITESKEFRWGKTNLSVEYPGNRTISSISENISFEVSIPTEIVDLDYPKNIKEDGVDEFSLKGRLVNLSSGEGIEGQNISLLLNGEKVGSVVTGERGTFTFLFSDDHEVEKGRHVLTVRSEGSKKFRSARSDDLQIEVEEQQFWRSYTFFGLIAILIGGILVTLYLFSSEEEEKEEVESVEKKIKRPRSKFSIPNAASSKDIPSAYRNFLDILQSSGFIEISRGKTHQEIEKEIRSHPKMQGFENHIKFVTDRFEKVLFTEKSISSSEIEKFNSAISKLTEEVSH